MSKFTNLEKEAVKSTVAILTIKRIPDKEIIKAIAEQTNKTVTVRHLTRIKQQIKQDSSKWYSQLRQGEHDFIHEFCQRINEVLLMQKKLHQIIDSNENNPSIQLDAISELHKLTITLSNLIDVAPSIGIYNNTLPEKANTANTGSIDRDNIIV
jgi:hypothetical protein